MRPASGVVRGTGLPGSFVNDGASLVRCGAGGSVLVCGDPGFEGVVSKVPDTTLETSSEVFMNPKAGQDSGVEGDEGDEER